MQKESISITNFNRSTESNFENYINESDPVIRKIHEIDSLISEVFALIKDSVNISESFFLNKARSLFFSATRIGVGGQSPDVYPLVRAMLESALYAWYIKQKPDRFSIWIKRLDGGTDRSKARNLFAFHNIIKEFDEANPKLAKIVRETYEFHIDFGAHPNPSGVISGIRIVENENSTKLVFNLLHSFEMDSFHAAIKEIARTGVAVLEIYRLIFSDEFKRNGIEERIQKVMIGL
jgi:hypothetical protein